MSPSHEYLVVPAPRRAPKIKGVRDAAERFAIAVAEVMNEAGREGWEYLRTDTLPMEVRSGWLGARAVSSQELLVFRRAVGRGEAATEEPDPTFARTPEPQRGGGAVTPLSLRPASQRPPRAYEPPEHDPDGGPGRPRLGGARRE